jgi:hypothetical protein
MSDLSSLPTATEKNQRVRDAWREWLLTLARDPAAAHAAALAYRQLGAEEREQWLLALEQDSALLSVPKIAVYAPLMAVEVDKQRRRRMESALQTCRFATERSFNHSSKGGGAETGETHAFAAEPNTVDGLGSPWDASAQAAPTWASEAVPRGLLARDPSGVHLAVLISPLYLGFVQVLACAFDPGQRFLWVRHDPISRAEQAPRAGTVFDGMKLQSEPLNAIVDELARTILAHQRAQLALPEALRLFADWFSVNRDEECPL